MIELENIILDDEGIKKVLIIGLGQLGLPVARYVREKGFDTYGYDISISAMERAQKIAGIKEVTDFSEIDAFIICVSTHKPDDMSTPQIEGLLSVVQDIAIKAKNGALVSIESTIPRGTSKKVFEMLNHRLHVAHVPHRFYSLEEKDHGVNQVRVVGGMCDCCLKAEPNSIVAGLIWMLAVLLLSPIVALPTPIPLTTVLMMMLIITR